MHAREMTRNLEATSLACASVRSVFELKSAKVDDAVVDQSWTQALALTAAAVEVINDSIPSPMELYPARKVRKFGGVEKTNPTISTLRRLTKPTKFKFF